MEWISVDDRLPQDAEEVLICDEENDVYAVLYQDECWHWHNYNYARTNFIWGVKYWMPLPKPQQESDGEYEKQKEI